VRQLLFAPADNLGMSRPRCAPPGKTFAVSRRCSERRSFLRPDSLVTKVLLFCLAFAASTYKIQIHVAVAMSNHYHLVVTDLEGNLSAFMGWLNQNSASFLKSYWKRKLGEVIWGAGKFSSVLLLSPEAVLEEIVYAILNPVKAGLVSTHKQWGGMMITPETILQQLKPTHPDRDIALKNHREKVLNITVPPAYRHMGTEAFIALVMKKVKEGEAKIRRQRRGKKVAGMAKVRRASHLSVPSTEEESGKLNPQFAGVTAEAIAYGKKVIKGFHLQYKDALERYMNGEHDVVFPFGTNWMRLRFKVNVATSWE